MKLQHPAEDLLRGLLCAACPVLFSAAAFAGRLPVTAAAAALSVLAGTQLLRTKHCTSRRVRSITAGIAFLPLMISGICFGLHGAVYACINPAYVHEYGGPNAGDCAGLLLIWFPASVILLLLSVFIAGQPAKPQPPDTE